MHPSPETPTTPELSHPPEPPGFKEDVNEAGNYIPDSVALPIGLNNADRALPVASVVPIITDAMGAAETVPPIIPSNLNSANQNSSTFEPSQQQTASQDIPNCASTGARAPARRVPSFFRQSSTHPAPAAATLADPQPPQEERDKSDSPGCKCTPCKKVMAVAVFVVAVIAAVGIGLTLSGGPDEPDEPGDPDINTHNAKYPNCHVANLSWLNDGMCDGGRYDKGECGWDGGDCLFDKFSNRKCTGSIGSIWTDRTRAWCQNKCTEQAITCAAYDFSGGKCRIFDSYSTKTNKSNSKCYVKNDHANVVVSYPNCNVPNLHKINDGNCDGGEYNTEQCGWDGGDCIIPDWPNCHINNPAGLGNGLCNSDSKADTFACGYDGGDCTESSLLHLKSFASEFPECDIDSMNIPFSWVHDGWCDPSLNTEKCGWDGGDCDEDNKKLWKTYPECKGGIDPETIGNGKCDENAHNTAGCGWDGGDCEELNRKYPNCNKAEVGILNNGYCWESLNTAECGWDGGDCLFHKYDDKACEGTIQSVWSDKTFAWCQSKCLDKGANCEAYDFSDYPWYTAECRIFSSYSSRKQSSTRYACWEKK